MRIDGSTLNPFRGLQPFGQQAQGGSGVPGVPSLSQGNEASTGFAINVNSYTPPPPPGLEGVFDQSPSTTASTSASSTLSMTDLAQDMGAPESTSDAFALEIARRMQGQVDENGEAKDTKAFAAALSNAVDWIKDQHGEMTANAVMAGVLGSTGDAASEQTVSNGLLGALKLVDITHGIQAGDAALNHFNGALNRELNAYFDNGLNEQFLAVTHDASGTSITNASLSSRFMRQSVEAAAGTDSQQSLSETLLGDLSESMTDDLQEAATPEALATAKARKAMTAYGFVAAPEPEFLSTTA